MLSAIKTGARLSLLVLLCIIKISAGAQLELPAENGLYLADPTIFHHQDTFYLYGTVGSGPNNGFIGYTSTDLKNWEKSPRNSGYVLRKGAAFGTAGFWAPQVFAKINKFYMAYVANENIAIAESSHPLGPFTQNQKVPLAAPVKQIDPFVFMDNDGKIYLYHVRLVKGNNIFVAEMTPDFTAIKPETLKPCLVATEPWENTANADWPVMEGPSVLKRNNLYYLFYTANDFRNPDYATGYATSTSPYGPWKKFSGNPIVSRKGVGINGTGHGDFVTKGKDLFYVFHTHFSDSVVAPRRTAIVPVRFQRDGAMDKMVADEKAFFFPVLKDKVEQKQ